MNSIIEIKDLKKSFYVKDKKQKKIVEAVSGVSLTVNEGEIFGFLGPNGAGKTTTLRMLTTLLPIDEGTVKIAGLDVKKEAKKVRNIIGFVSQIGGGDVEATGIENLMLQGRLYGMSLEEAKKSAEDVLELFGLKEIQNRIVRTYSGGQKRRLEIALGMMHKPKVLFLDEPTTGLDPQNRANMWDYIRKLNSLGTTVFITTHYLDEADELANRIAIMDNGKIVALDTPKELKKQISGDVITIKTKNGENGINELKGSIQKESYVREVSIDNDKLQIYVNDGTKDLPKIFIFLEGKNIVLDTVHLREPSLDDVFLKKTGRKLREGEQSQ
ncbi:MAG: ATP-binding cassette domain-containing protein [Oscillospiraceae bacterium]|nr:ATP-binding cassette domain-containing protein [Oscillospiraceae bacterium]